MTPQDLRRPGLAQLSGSLVTDVILERDIRRCRAGRPPSSIGGMDTTTTGPAAVELLGLVKTFRSPGGQLVRAVGGVDLTVSPGEVVAFLGPNGAGKTTALDMVLGLTTPSAGTVTIFGADLARPS